ncbi:hypothetical protein GC207_11525 [bacterium]|nr:hypothetical protein [bacterium]
MHWSSLAEKGYVGRQGIMITQRLFLALVAVAFAYVPIANASDPGWNRYFSLHPQSGISAGFTQFEPCSDRPGYLLSYGTYSSAIVSKVSMRLGADGALLWSAYLHPNSDPAVAYMTSAHGGEDVLAGYAEQSGTLYLSENVGQTLKSKWGCSLPVTDPTKVSFHHFADDSSAVIEDLGTSISVLLLNAAGDKLIDRVLQPSGLGNSVKWIAMWQNTNASEYVVCYMDYVQKSPGTSPIDPPVYSKRIYYSRLDLNGNHLGTTKTSFDTTSLGDPSWTLGSNGDVLLQFYEFSFDQVTYAPIPKSRLICLQSDGTRSWSAAIDNAYLDSVNFAGGDYFLGGHKEVQGVQTPVLLRVSGTDGTLQAQTTLESTGGAVVKPIGIYQDRVYAEFWVSLGHLLCSFDGNLGNAVALRLNSSSTPKFIRIEPTENKLLYYDAEGVTAVDPSLTVLDECGNLGAAAVSAAPVDLAISGFVPTVATASTTVSERQRTISPATLPLFVPDLWLHNICGPDVLKPVELTLEWSALANSYRLRFETDTQTMYSLEYSDDLNQGFNATESWNGSGWSIFYPLNNLLGEHRFYRLQAFRP